MKLTIQEIFQIITACLLTAAILLQQRGSGLSSAFGGDSNVYRKKRGFERILFISTIVLAILFVGGSLVGILL